MTSREFVRRVRPFVPTHTEHFVHELISFARSQFDIIGYDRYVSYHPIFEGGGEDVVAVSSSDESDVTIVPYEGAPSATTNQIYSRIATIESPTIIESSSSNESSSSFIVLPHNSGRLVDKISEQITEPQSLIVAQTGTHLSEDDSEEEELANYLQIRPLLTAEESTLGRSESPLSNKHNGYQSASAISKLNIQLGEPSSAMSNNISTVPSSTVSVILQNTNCNTNNTNEPPANVEHDSDSDDCLFVCAKKPPHLRTPEFVELNSETDSDVVFVEEVLPICSGIKVENSSGNSCSKTHVESNVIVKPQPTTIIMSTSDAIDNRNSKMVMPSSRRKQGHSRDNSPFINNNELGTTLLSNAISTSTITLPGASMESKPSTSSQWMHRLYPIDSERHSNSQESNEYYVLKRPSVTKYNLSKFLAGRSRNCKRIYESSSSNASDNDKTTDAGMTSSASSLSSNNTDYSDSSSHEEFPKHPKLKSTNSESITRKKYRKKSSKLKSAKFVQKKCAKTVTTNNTKKWCASKTDRRKKIKKNSKTKLASSTDNDSD